MGGKPTVPAQYACIGEFLWDHFGDGRTLGGAPSNVAFHLAQLGESVALVSRVGADPAGRRAIAELADAGVEVSQIQIDSERPTGRVDVVVEAGEPRYRLHTGCAWERIECDRRVRRALRGARGVCFGTLAQRTPDGERGHRDMLSELSAEAIALCDVNFRRGFDDWPTVGRSLADATAVKINDSEMNSIAAHFGTGDAADLADRFDLSHVAVTHGAAGATLWSRDRAATEPGAPSAAGGDNVGCGDAFTAVLLIGLSEKRDLAAVARAANEYAAFVAGERGATPLAPPALVRRVRAALDT